MRPAPDRIPRSGNATRGVNCTVATVSHDDGAWALLVSSTSKHGISGRILENGSFDAACSAPWRVLENAKFEFLRFVGPYEFRHHSIVRFLFAETFGIYRFAILKDRTEQYFFNRTRLARAERIGILKALLERTLGQREYTASPVTLMTNLHSSRWVFHPEHEKLLAYYKLLLDSLVASGDLIVDGIAYRISPKALGTLASAEEDDRRHSDSISQQRALKWLTVALVLIGAVQAYMTYIANSG
jgi:hypothetical protein